MARMARLAVFFILLSFTPVFASKAPTEHELQLSIEHNKALSKKFQGLSTWSQDLTTSEVVRPYSEVEPAGYLLFHSATPFNTEVIKNALATHLPSDVKLVVLTDRPLQANSLKRHYSKFTGKDRVDVIAFKYKSSYRAVWARDNTPIPVLSKKTSGAASWSAVDAKYYGGDEPDLGIAQWFKVLLSKNPYEFEGGNFVVDSKGNCIIVNKIATSFIPDSIFNTLYGCKKVVRLRHLAGIGHADERVKFISDTLALTDTESYIPELQSLGYDVRLLPKPEKGEFRTYVNSLSINDSLFVPVFDEPNDRLALEVYQGTGKKIVPLNSTLLSDRGNGSIHCITMTYPPMPKEELQNLFR